MENKGLYLENIKKLNQEKDGWIQELANFYSRLPQPFHNEIKQELNIRGSGCIPFMSSKGYDNQTMSKIKAQADIYFSGFDYIRQNIGNIVLKITEEERKYNERRRAEMPKIIVKISDYLDNMLNEIAKSDIF